MDLKKYIIGHILRVKVVPNASRTELIVENGSLKLYVRAVPDKNKANVQVVKFFKKEFGLRVEIKSGARVRQKVLRILE